MIDGQMLNVILEVFETFSAEQCCQETGCCVANVYEQLRRPALLSDPSCVVADFLASALECETWDSWEAWMVVLEVISPAADGFQVNGTLFDDGEAC